MSYLVINKGTAEVYERETLVEVAQIVHNERSVEEVRSEMSWSIKRTGRWDREDGFITVIPREPDNE